MSENQPRVVLFEGPQGSGKTTAAKSLTEYGYNYFRCIPSGEELTQNSSETNWSSSLRLMSSIQNDYNRYAVDRCLWSIVVYRMRSEPENDYLVYKDARDDFLKLVTDEEYSIAIINSSTSEVLERQESETSVAITDVYTAQLEIDAHNRLMSYLDQDGFPVHYIHNTGITKEEFLQNVLDTLKIVI